MFVAPARERGLKYSKQANKHGTEGSRSRKGAWIEIWTQRIAQSLALSVAPARERGLKYGHNE